MINESAVKDYYAINLTNLIHLLSVIPFVHQLIWFMINILKYRIRLFCLKEEEHMGGSN